MAGHIYAGSMGCASSQPSTPLRARAPRSPAADADPSRVIIAGVATSLAAATLDRDFSFDGRTVAAKIVSVYDGDTCRARFWYGGELVQWQVRLAGYDSPEMHPHLSNPNREAEIDAAVRAKIALTALINGRIVSLACGKFDKYGRILGTVVVDGVNVNEKMVADRHGRAYFGGAKDHWG